MEANTVVNPKVQPKKLTLSLISTWFGQKNNQGKLGIYAGLRLLVGVIFLLFSFPKIGLTQQQQQPQQQVQDFEYWVSVCASWQEIDNKELYPQVLQACDQALIINPNQAKVWSDRGNLLLAMNRYTEAVASFERVISLEPSNSQAWTRKCMGLSKLGKYTEAIEACEIALRVDSNWDQTTPAIAWNYRGVSWAKLAKPEEALFSFNWATRLNPDYSQAWAYRCQMLYDLGNYQEALTSCDRALQSNQYWEDSTPGLAWTNRGRVSQALGWYDEALNAYNQALALDPKDAIAWTEQGMLLSRLGRYAEAKASLEWAVGSRPDYSLALAYKCANHNRLKEFEEALKACEQAIKGDGQWGKEGAAIAWNHQGNALTGLARYQEALAAFNRAIAVQPNYASAWSNRSVTFWHLGRYNDALASSERAIELDSASSLAWYNQARILTTLGQLDEAVAAYDRALKGDANVGEGLLLAETWVNLSALFWRLERYSEAIRAADSAIGIKPDYGAAWYNKALAQMALRRYADAVITYDRAINIDPQNANFWAGKGIALRFLQRYPESLAALEQALKLNPNHPQALLNRDLVQQQLTPLSTVP